MTLRWRALVVAAAVAGCGAAREVRTKFPLSVEEPGSLELRFSSQVDHLLVTVNGHLVVTDARTRRVSIDGVPPGTTTVMVAADGAAERMFTLEVAAGQHVVVPLAGGGGARGPSVWQTLLGAAITITYLTVRSLL